MQLIENREQQKQNPSMTDQTGNKVYMPSDLPENPNAQIKPPEYPHNDNQKLFTRDARDAVEGLMDEEQVMLSLWLKRICLRKKEEDNVGITLNKVFVMGLERFGTFLRKLFHLFQVLVK